MSYTPVSPLPALVPAPARALALAAALVLTSLAGCSSLEDGQAADGVDYRAIGAKKVSLAVPPDLTQLARDARYQPAGGTLTATQLQSAQGTTAIATSQTAVTPPAAKELRLVRAGSQRWVASALTPEEVWPQLKAFWTENGLGLESEQPEIGLMVTEWSENRANLPQDIIRRTIGRVFTRIYDTGLRDQYRARVERTETGSEIVITHRGMEEVYTDSSREQTRWQPRPNDPELEATMLTRLMVKLGAGKEEAKAAVVAAATARARAVPGQPNVVLLDDTFDRAWRRVAIALDRTGFTVEDRDRSQGTFFVRYADPKLAGKEQPGFFARMFSDAKTFETTARYRVTLKSDAASTSVNVLDAQGGVPAVENVAPIVQILVDELK